MADAINCGDKLGQISWICGLRRGRQRWEAFDCQFLIGTGHLYISMQQVWCLYKPKAMLLTLTEGDITNLETGEVLTLLWRNSER